MNKKVFAAALAAAALMAAPVTPALAKKPSPVASLDTDNDATVDLAEIKMSAEGLFDKLDTDKDGSIGASQPPVQKGIQDRRSGQ